MLVSSHGVLHAWECACEKLRALLRACALCARCRSNLFKLLVAPLARARSLTSPCPYRGYWRACLGGRASHFAHRRRTRLLTLSAAHHTHCVGTSLSPKKELNLRGALAPSNPCASFSSRLAHAPFILHSFPHPAPLSLASVALLLQWQVPVSFRPRQPCLSA